MPFERTLYVSWPLLDANGHMGNTGYLDLAIDVRFMYFASRGLPPDEFRRLNIGPVVRRDEVDYYRELRLLDTVRVNMLLAGLSEDASRFRLRHEIRREGGELAARVTTLAGLFDLATRRLVAPPPAFADALRDLERSDDFEPLASSVRG